jgi:hypothetical protein
MGEFPGDDSPIEIALGPDERRSVYKFKLTVGISDFGRVGALKPVL